MAVQRLSADCAQKGYRDRPTCLCIVLQRTCRFVLLGAGCQTHGKERGGKDGSSPVVCEMIRHPFAHGQCTQSFLAKACFSEFSPHNSPNHPGGARIERLVSKDRDG